MAPGDRGHPARGMLYYGTTRAHIICLPGILFGFASDTVMVLRSTVLYYRFFMCGGIRVIFLFLFLPTRRLAYMLFVTTGYIITGN